MTKQILFQTFLRFNQICKRCKKISHASQIKSAIWPSWVSFLEIHYFIILFSILMKIISIRPFLLNVNKTYIILWNSKFTWNIFAFFIKTLAFVWLFFNISEFGLFWNCLRPSLDFFYFSEPGNPVPNGISDRERRFLNWSGKLFKFQTFRMRSKILEIFKFAKRGSSINNVTLFFGQFFIPRPLPRFQYSETRL